MKFWRILWNLVIDYFFLKKSLYKIQVFLKFWRISWSMVIEFYFFEKSVYKIKVLWNSGGFYEIWWSTTFFLKKSLFKIQVFFEILADFMKFGIRVFFFFKSVYKIQVLWNCDIIIDTLHEYVRTFTTTSPWIIIRISNKPYCCTVYFVESLQLITNNCTYKNQIHSDMFRSFLDHHQWAMFLLAKFITFAV
jgi:hypothetical protein